MISRSSIKSVSFDILSEDVIKKRATVIVKEKDSQKSMEPLPGGVSDLKMGTTSNSYKCNTCKNPRNTCMGHAGEIILNYPIINPLFINYVIRWLKIICLNCGKSLFPGVKHKKLDELAKQATAKNNKQMIECWNCGVLHPNIKKDETDTVSILKEIKKEDSDRKEVKRLYNHEIKISLERIDESLVHEFNIVHPKHYVNYHNVAPPNTLRPDTVTGGSKKSVDEFTILLRDIVELNKSLPLTIPNEINDDDKLATQYRGLNILFYNMFKGVSLKNKVGNKTKSKKKQKSFIGELTSKEGLVRKNLMGKRCEIMGRSVITGDPVIPIGSAGIPKKLAKKLWKEEVVMENNIDRLSLYLLNGTKKYPGSKYLIRNGDTHDIDKINERKETLRLGDILIRNLIDGDIVSLNRAPSLLFCSISSHNAIIMDTDSILLNPAACVLYNADFDGDAMNIIVGTSESASVESYMLSAVSNWFISKQNSKSLMGFFHDTLVGSFLLTKESNKLHKFTAMKMFARIDEPELDFSSFNKSNLVLSGKEIMGQLIKKYKSINYKKRSNHYKPEWEAKELSDNSSKQFKAKSSGLVKYNDNDKFVVIKNGKYESGILDKSTVGQGASGSLLHLINSEYGAKHAIDFIHKSQQLIDTFMMTKGLTISVKDMLIPKDTRDILKQITNNLIDNSLRITDKLKMGRIVKPIGMSTYDAYETEQQIALTIGDDVVYEVMNVIDHENNGIYQLYDSGSKGKLKENLVSMSVSLGSQTINGVRIEPIFGHNRTLPYFTRFDSNPESRGFVSNGYMNGLLNYELIFNSMGGRYSIINRSLSTAITGDHNRKTMKNLESQFVDNLRCVSKLNNIVQFCYGDDNVDTGRMEEIIIPTIKPSEKNLQELYKSDISMFDSKFNNQNVKNMLNAEYERILQDRNEYRRISLTFEHQHDSKVLLSDISYSPINVKRLISSIAIEAIEDIKKLSAVNSSSKDSKKSSNIDPVYSIEKVQLFCDNLPYIMTNSIREKNKAWIPEYHVKSVMLVAMLVRLYLCTRRLIDWNIDRDKLDAILNKIKAKYAFSLVDYGEAVGIIATQSISECLSQYVLDSMHFLSAGGSKVGFLDRYSEIVNVKSTDKMESPVMILYVKKEYEKDQNKVKEIANHIEMIQLKSFITSNLVFFETFGEPIYPKYVHEKKLISTFVKHNPNYPKPTNLTKWVIRYELDRLLMMSKNMEWMTIIIKLKSIQDIYVVHSDESDDKLIIRVYLKNTLIQKKNIDKLFVEKYMEYINTIIIRGIDKIQAVSVIKVPRTIVTDDGEILDKKDEIYAINTLGINLEDTLLHPDLDAKRITCNSLQDIQAVFGVDAARRKFINELRNIIGAPTIKHFYTYADEITLTGQLTPINRIGSAKRERNNTLLHISDSFIMQNLINATINKKKDVVYSPSSYLMLGSTVKNGGSLFNDIFIDMEKIEQSSTSIDNLIDLL